MIATILIVALAFTWLLIETDFLRVRLATHEYQKNEALQSKFNGINTGMNSNHHDNGIPYKPADFTLLDMPEMAGNLNILCQRGE